MTDWNDEDNSSASQTKDSSDSDFETPLYEMSDYDGNVLAITDAQVARNWKLGMLRALGEQIFGGIEILESNYRGAPVSGGFNEHLAGKVGDYNPSNRCEIVEIYKLEETIGLSSDYGQYGYSDRPITILTAEVVCKCGRINHESAVYEVGPSGLSSLAFGA